MIAVPAISSAGVLPQTQTDAVLLADDNIANPGFIDLLTLLAVALQPQPDPGDGDDGAAPLAPDRDRPAEHEDEAASDPTLIVALTAQTIFSAQTIEPSQPAGLPLQVSGGENDHPPPLPTGADDAKAAAERKPTNPADLTVAGSDHEPIPLEPIDAAKQKVPLSEAIEVHSNSTAIADAPAVAMKSFSPADGQHRTNAAAQQTPTPEAADNEALTIEAPTRQLTVASQGRSSFADGEARSFGQQGKFKPSEAVVELPDSANPRFAHVQPEAGVAPSRQRENIANESGATTWRPVLDRVAQEIKTHIQFGEHEAVIQLEPPELGKIKIDLRLDGGQIHARIVAEEPSTQALIENHWADLRQALDIRQVDLVNVRVDPQTANSGGGQWAQGQERGAGANADPSANGAAAAALAESEAADPGRISMWV
jgi:flagellar hook-length control protein FliK